MLLDDAALKRAVAEATMAQLPPLQGVIGVGTGSTVNAWLDLLATSGQRAGIEAAVASSVATAERLKAIGIPVVDLNGVDVRLYIDGADEINPDFQLIKGGGGALTREKIIATSARHFVVMADHRKCVDQLGRAFPLPIEVVPMARGLVARECIKLGGQPVYREGVVTDNGGVILDVHHLDLREPLAMDKRLNQMVGVICHGLFVQRPADQIFCAQADGTVKELEVRHGG